MGLHKSQDGGSIARRDDLVKTKPKAQVADKKNQLLAAWFFCALSKNELQPPVVVCPLGRLYNKDSLLEFLLNPPSATLPLSQTPFGADGQATAGHIRSLKDVQEIKLTPNPDYNASTQTHGQSGAEASVGYARWICPLSQREMNGSVRFNYLKHCGHVVSEAALKEIRAASKKTSQGELAPCSICGQAYQEGEAELGYVINPPKEESEAMRRDWEARKAVEKANKKSKKRKAADADDSKARKVHVAESATNHTASGAPRLPSEVAAALEVQKQKIAKTAVASLYRKHDPSKKEDWMVRGTFSR